MTIALAALPTQIGTKKVRFVTPDGREYVDLVPDDVSYVILIKTVMNTNTYWVRHKFISDAIAGEIELAKMNNSNASMSLLVEAAA